MRKNKKYAHSIEFFQVVEFENFVKTSKIKCNEILTRRAYNSMLSVKTYSNLNCGLKNIKNGINFACSELQTCHNYFNIQFKDIIQSQP